MNWRYAAVPLVDDGVINHGFTTARPLTLERLLLVLRVAIDVGLVEEQVQNQNTDHDISGDTWNSIDHRPLATYRDG